MTRLRATGQANEMDDPAAERKSCFETFAGMASVSRRRFESLADLAIILFVFPSVLAVLFGPLAHGGRILAVAESDATIEWWWKRQYLGQVMRSGHLPQWNPYAMCGAPLLATSQPAPFYPGNWPYAWLPEALVMNANILFHWWLGLTGMFVLMRRGLRRSLAAGLLAAAVFGLGGISIQHWRAGHLQFNAEIAMIPWAVACLFAIQASRNRRDYCFGGLALAFVIAMQLLAGHPQIVYYTILVLVVLHSGWLLTCAVMLREGWRSVLGSTGAIVCAGLMAAGMTAMQFLPLLEFAKLTVRTQNEPMQYFTAHSQHLSNLYLCVAPWAFGGTPGPTLFYMDTNGYWETTAFTGVTVLLMCIAAFARLHRTAPIIWICAGSAVVCELLALGSNWWLFEWTFHHVPGFNLFRCPGRMLIPMTLFVAMLGGIGLDELARLGARRRDWPLLIALGVITLIVVAASIVWNRAFEGGATSATFKQVLETRLPWLTRRPFDAQTLQKRFAEFSESLLPVFKIAAVMIAIIPLLAFRWTRMAGCLAIAAVGAWEIFGYARVCGSSIDPVMIGWPTEFAEKLGAAGPMYRMGSAHSALDLCQGMVSGVRQVWGYETGVVQRYNEAIAASQKISVASFIMNQPQTKLSPMLDSMGLRYLVYSRIYPDIDPRWRSVLKTKGVELLENPNALPRIRVMDQALTASATEAVRLVNDPAFNPKGLVIIEAETSVTNVQAQLTSGSLEEPGTVEVTRDEAEHLGMQVSMNRRGWLVVMDQLLPGWTARLDGAPVRMFRANAIGRAVQLPEGHHTVEMHYRAPGLRAGMTISAFVWVLWFVGTYSLAWNLRFSMQET